MWFQYYDFLDPRKWKSAVLRELCCMLHVPIVCIRLFWKSRSLGGIYGDSRIYIWFSPQFNLFEHLFFLQLFWQRLKIADVVYDGWWYLRPEKLRRYYQMTIMKAQKPKFLRGYSYLDCSLETFAAVHTCYKLNEKIHMF